MKYQMKLHNYPFNKIKIGTKKIEMRLNDEKRKLIKIGDVIEFTNIITNEILQVEVINLYYFKNFEELYEKFDKQHLGYDENENAEPNDMNIYYSKEDQEKYGVLGIEIKLI